MGAKISVVIPVYNAEKFLKRCIDTILSQTFNDYEIILVDDGSKDGSGELCDKYAAEYSFIRSVHKQNGGAASARNVGIREANGEYISFIDADDWLEDNMYERLVSATDNSPDLVMCDYKRPSDNNGSYKFVTYPLPAGYYNRERILEHIYPCLIMHNSFDFTPLIAPWNKLYKRKLLIEKNIFFDEKLRFCEDELFAAEVSEKMQSFYYLKEEYLYVYYFNPSSSVTSYNPRKWEVYIDLYEKMKNRYSNNKDYDFTYQLKMLIIYLALNAACNCKVAGLGFFKTASHIRKIFSHPYLTEAFKNFEYPNVSKNEKTVIKAVQKKRAFLYTAILKFGK